MTTHVTTIGVGQPKIESVGSRWNWLFKAGGVAALLSIVFFPIQILVIILNPPPNTVIGWFTMFQNNRLVGLLDLDLLLIFDEALVILIFLALYVALRRVSESFMAMGTTLGIVSTVLFIAANPAFAMLSLSDQYAASATVAQRAMFLAAGQALLAAWQGSSFQAGYFLGSVAPIIISVVMLRSRLFSKATAYMGIVANVIALGLYVPIVGTYISIFSVMFLWIWYILVARRFFQLGQGISNEDVI